MIAIPLAAVICSCCRSYEEIRRDELARWEEQRSGWQLDQKAEELDRAVEQLEAK
jgi:hypothetical protein